MKINDHVVQWLASVGLEVEFATEDPPECFIPGVWLDRGKIIVNPARAHVGDILHEAGHLACIPSCFRDLVEPGMLPGEKLEQAIHDYTTTHLFCDHEGREDPVFRGIMQMSDPEATAWAYAASKELGISPGVLFSEREHGPVPYEGEGPHLWQMLDAQAYFGINGLRAAGFCTVRGFPTMLRWLAP
jgi:hypothetical protein